MEGPSDERRNDSAGWRKEPVFEWFFLPVFERVEHLAEYLADFECFWTLLQFLRDGIRSGPGDLGRFSECAHDFLQFLIRLVIADFPGWHKSPAFVAWRRIMGRKNRPDLHRIERVQTLWHALESSRRIRMMTHPASAIKREVCQLVERQIETLRQPASLTSYELGDYHARSEKITTLYRELDRMARTSFWESRRAS